ncbi:MAG: HicB family protein, partial [Lachnospiraceae bacterium]|nr:HicB family protein [Lachnospiraceae bacterium]
YVLVFVPDWEVYTEGSSFVDAIEMARDAIGLSGIVNENNGNEFPKVSSCEEAVMIAKKDADENMDFSTGILTLVEVVMFLVYSKRYLWRNLG